MWEYHFIYKYDYYTFPRLYITSELKEVTWSALKTIGNPIVFSWGLGVFSLEVSAPLETSELEKRDVIWGKLVGTEWRLILPFNSC